VLCTGAIDVVTSARRDYRAPRGFGHLLTRLEPDGAGEEWRVRAEYADSSPVS
jgi:hypothetical protein